MNLKPLRNQVVVKPLEAEEKTAGGIVLPDTAREKSTEGEVLAVGNGLVLPNGRVVPVSVKKGDKVIYSKYGGSEVKVDGKELKIVGEGEILAVID